MDRVVGLDGVPSRHRDDADPGRPRPARADEKFLTPTAVGAEPENASGNTLGLRSMMFAVDDIDAAVAGLLSYGAELVGEVARYQDSYRLCYVRGPEGIIVALAEQLQLTARRGRPATNQNDPRGWTENDNGRITVQPNEITEVLNRPISQELLARDVTRLAYVAKDSTPRIVPIIFTWNGSQIVMCTSKNAPKLQASRREPDGCPDDRHRGAPTQDLAHPGPGRAGLRRWHPGRVSPGDQHLRDDARATGRVGGGGAFALPTAWSGSS